MVVDHRSDHRLYWLERVVGDLEQFAEICGPSHSGLGDILELLLLLSAAIGEAKLLFANSLSTVAATFILFHPRHTRLLNDSHHRPRLSSGHHLLQVG